MNETDHEANKDSEDSIEPRGNQALVISTDFSRMPEIVRFIAGLPRTRIVYQRVAAPGTRLLIIEGEGRAR
jgi:hypothetical protein